jgi:N-acetylneuraminic acid mutarotase
VQVSDGRLTVTNAAGSSNNKIAFIDITSDGGPGLPQVSIVATDGSAAETAGNAGRFTVTRTGPTDEALVVNLTVGGSATNGSDYAALGTIVTIPVGSASAVVNIAPVDDSAAEGIESVLIGVAASGSYTVASPSTATVSILDNDATGATLTWREVAPAPVGRSEAFGAVVGGKLYVFGGYVDSTFKPTRRADVYDPAANTWRQLADLPSWAYPLGGASHVGTSVVGSSIYFAGGYPASTSSQTFSTKAVLKYDTTTNTYTALPSLPEARGGAALVALGNVLHFLGGSDSARNDAGTHWQLDLDNLSAGWLTKAPLPVATNHVAGVALGGKVYAIGGQQKQDDAAIQRAEVQVYDPATDRWTARAPLPSARSHITSATFVRDGRILVLGGLGPGNTVLNKVSSYDPVANTWTNLTNLPSGRLSGISDVLPDGRILFSTGGGGGYRTTTWVGEWA